MVSSYGAYSCLAAFFALFAAGVTVNIPRGNYDTDQNLVEHVNGGLAVGELKHVLNMPDHAGRDGGCCDGVDKGCTAAEKKGQADGVKAEPEENKGH